MGKMAMRGSVVAIGLALMASQSLAAEPQVGRWAADVHNCGSGGDTHKTAPLTVTATSLQWSGEHCTVGKMYKADRALYIEGRCSNSSGLMTKHPITLAMRGDRLAVTWNGEQIELQRCQ
jgi:hypothetical protein